MAGGPIRGIRRLTKREAGHLPIVQVDRGGKYTDAEHGLINISKALVEEADHETSKPKGSRDVTKLIQIARQFREWIEDTQDREEAKRRAEEAKARGEQPAGGDAAAPGGADPYGALGAFGRRPEGGVGA